jgi:hypothetical protein
MKTIRLKNLELGFVVENRIRRRAIVISFLPEIQFQRHCDIFYYLRISWLTFEFCALLINIKKQYEGIFDKVNG